MQQKLRVLHKTFFTGKITIACKFANFFERLKRVRNELKISLHSPMVSLKKKSESLIKYYIKVTCALK